MGGGAVCIRAGVGWARGWDTFLGSWIWQLRREVVGGLAGASASVHINGVVMSA